MNTALRWPVLGVAVAIAVTSAMDASGLTVFSALPLAALLAAFWYPQRLPRQEVGFVWARRQHYAVAVLYPVAVGAMLTGSAAIAGAIDLSHTNWKKAGINFALTTVSTVLVWTSVAFASWHWSEAVLKTGFEPPRSQVPVFLMNIAVIGAIWGLLRERSGSVIVSSLSHGLWNGMAYVLFGIGARTGALGIRNAGLFGAEVGLLGLVFNAAFLLALWVRYHRSGLNE